MINSLLNNFGVFQRLAHVLLYSLVRSENPYSVSKIKEKEFPQKSKR